jgi:hypothetical protein
MHSRLLAKIVSANSWYPWFRSAWDKNQFVLIQEGPRQMNPLGLPGMNLGSDAGTDGSGYGVQK